MSWFQKLYATYESCVENPHFTTPAQADGEKEVPALMPISHTSQQAHIAVTLDGEGNFLRAELLPPKTLMVIPATEESANRTGNDAPHGLIEKIHYCAKDYNGTKENLFASYHAQLQAWCASPHSHPKARAVLAYVSKGTLVQDLLAADVMHADADSAALLTEPPKHLKDSIFSLLVAKKGVRDQGDALVAWRVLMPDDLETQTWKDESLQAAWVAFDATLMAQKERNFCMVQGKESAIAGKHQRFIRRPGDGAKLVSSNDKDGFTFRGRFREAAEACTIGYEVSHKAHNALRWLLARQGYRNGDQAVVAWAENGAPLPNPCENYVPPEDVDFDAVEEVPAVKVLETHRPKDLGRDFSTRLRNALRGYRAKLNDSESIAILALDAASPGRLSVVFYREQMPEHYLHNLERWQEDCAWVLPITVQENDANKDEGKARTRRLYLPGAPTPDTIARTAYGRRIDDKLRKATVERLLPCIVDGTPLPRDLVECCVRRACNRPGLESWEWPEVLGVACALYKGFHTRHSQHEERRTYTMALEKERCTRDYLYGRLLAVAEYVERTALDRAEEKRPTNAERLMQRFADHPYATWRQIYLHLEPYLQRLRSSEKLGWLPKDAQKLIQEISDKFTPEEFASTRKLSGEFLLGYHCQMSAFYTKREKEPTAIAPEQEGENP